MNLFVLDLSTAEGQSEYRRVLQTMNVDHPYYKGEFLDTFYDGLERARAFVLNDDTGEAVVVMPVYIRPIEASPGGITYYDSISTWGYSGPLLANNSEISVLCHFWSVVDRWYQENQVISEFIRFNLTGNHRFYSGTVVPGMHNIKGRIIEPDMIWKNYVHKVRTNIRRARKVGLTVKICHRTISEEEFKAFYKIFKHTLDRNNAETIYYHPSDKLKTFIRNNPESCLIALTLKDNIPIAAELVLISKDTIYGFIGGTLAEYFPLRPNEILKHEVIRWAVNNKKRYYVLGGGYGYDDGIFRYKKSFFPGDIIDFQTGRKIIDQEIYSKLSGIDYLEYRIDKDFFPLYRKCRVPYKDLHLK